MEEPLFRALREISRDGRLSQRDLAGKLGLSLGRVNYIVNALIDSGLLKARRFKNSRNKLGYMYILTPAGMAAKARSAGHFLAEKTREYERLRGEIEDLRRELSMPVPEEGAVGGRSAEEG